MLHSNKKKLKDHVSKWFFPVLININLKIDNASR